MKHEKWYIHQDASGNLKQKKVGDAENCALG
jgi:hypothetical protein